ncbi:MAG TPA: ABC transporter substrate-binding protein, partial [Pyrinomonadaceae bacterium]|nr:ABC transporter substrate-binding protein [Pyrinomonadaceae bacterium]
MRDSTQFKLSRRFRGKSAPALLMVAAVLISFTACNELQGPKPEPYFAETKPPVRSEFRWSNGKLPTTIDPAKAASPPETDLVRAVFEGLTELDPATLTEVPAVAESWSSSEDLRTWTFVIRKEASWSDGRPVIPDDFIRSWRRAAESGDNIPHRALFANIVGMAELEPEKDGGATDEPSESEPAVSSIIGMARAGIISPTRQAGPTPMPGDPSAAEREKPTADPPVTGVRAADPRTLVVTLIHPDRDLPKLLAHPLFRPVPEGSGDLSIESAAGSISNGPFRISGAGPDGVNLERSDTYWNREAVKLERVAMV